MSHVPLSCPSKADFLRSVAEYSSPTSRGVVSLEVEVVIVGGQGDGEGTAIFDVSADQWRQGPDFPLGDVIELTGVQDGQGSFYLMSGDVDGVGHIDRIFRFDPETYEFVELEQRLPYSGDEVLAVMVSGEALGLEH